MKMDKRALDLFERCLGCDDAERSALLDRECAGDRALRLEVERLLTADSASHGFLDQPLGSSPANRVGEHVGPWEILREIGAGGMGTVYLARRADALYEKNVALKLLRIDAGDLRERFANERRILATLEHPSIAHLLDAGSDRNGLPYVAMEYVEGEVITCWCDQNLLSTSARIELFLKVLDAVQYAHGRLVVHRDLKPANILVDTRGEPKLLDFGIAKLIDAETPGLTRTGNAPLTPEYASPEQIRGETIGTASDVYALGVLLYELLVGERPYGRDAASRRDIERIVCDVEPTRPSLVAMQERGLRLDRDLDHVVLRAMAKSQTERYASCAQFADDLRRFLAGQPVLATNAGWRYRATKFARRHRVSVTLGLLIAAALLTSTLIALRQAHIANIERDRAAEINRFLQDMLSAADPSERGRDVTVASLLDTAAATLLQDTSKDDDVVASLRITLAETYNALGLLDPALAQARAATAIAERTNGLDNETRAHAFEILAEVLRNRSEYAEARQWATRAATQDDPAAVTWVGQAENLLGMMERYDRHFPEAEKHYKRALDVYEGRGAAPDEHVAVVLEDLGVLRLDQGNTTEAIRLLEQSLAIERRIHPAPHPQTAAILSSLADARAIGKNYEGAEAAFKEALSMRESLLGEAHPDTLFTMVSYASLLNLDLHRYVDGEAFARRAWNLSREHLPNPHQQTAYAGITLADSLMHLDRAGDAVPILRDTYAMRAQIMKADNPLLINTQSLLGAALAESGNVAEGEPLMRDAVTKLTALVGSENQVTHRAVDRLQAFEAKQAAQASSDATSAVATRGAAPKNARAHPHP